MKYFLLSLLWLLFSAKTLDAMQMKQWPEEQKRILNQFLQQHSILKYAQTAIHETEEKNDNLAFLVSSSVITQKTWKNIFDVVQNYEKVSEVSSLQSFITGKKKAAILSMIEAFDFLNVKDLKDLSIAVFCKKIRKKKLKIFP